MNSDAEHTRGLFACLGEASRYRIVATLSTGERCVTELAREVSLSQSCTTRHLQALERVGLVAGARRGKRVVFRLRVDDPRVGGLLEWIRADALEGRAGAPEPGRPGRLIGTVAARRSATGPAVAEGQASAATERGAGPDREAAADDTDADAAPVTGTWRRDLEDFLL